LMGSCMGRHYKGTPHKRKRNRAQMRELRQRALKKGWTTRLVWIPLSAVEKVNALATRFGMIRQRVLSAVVMSGLRRVTTHELVMDARDWREFVELPAGVRMKRGDFVCDREKNGRIVRLRLSTTAPGVTGHSSA